MDYNDLTVEGKTWMNALYDETGGAFNAESAEAFASERP